MRGVDGCLIGEDEGVDGCLIGEDEGGGVKSEELMVV